MPRHLPPSSSPGAPLLPLALAGACVLVVVLRLGVARRPWTQDETDLVSLAVAMADDARVWLRPDYHPAFELGGGTGARPPLGHGLVAPPLASALMSLPALLGLGPLGVWPLVGALVFVIGVAALACALEAPGGSPGLRVGRLAGLAGAVLAISLAPRAILDTLTLEAEVPLSGFACFALAFALRARAATTRTARIGAACASGAFLGLGFLTKLWLVGPPALAVLAALLAPDASSAAPARRARDSVALAGPCIVVAVLVSSAHLALVAALDPESLGRWLREVYLGGILSTKLSGLAAHPEWTHGAWYYPAAVARELGGAGLVLSASVGIALRTERRRGLAAWLASPRGFAVLGMAAGVAVISVPAVKEPLYVLPATALGLAFAARSLVLLTARAPRMYLALAATALVVTVTVPRPGVHADPRIPRIEARAVRPS